MRYKFDINSSLVAHYEGGGYPYIYETADGVLRGFIPALWKIIGEGLGNPIQLVKINNIGVEMDGDRSVPLSEVLIRNGSSLTFIDGTGLTQSWQRHGPPFNFGGWEFFELDEKDTGIVSDLWNFITYRFTSLILLIAGIALYKGLEAAREIFIPASFRRIWTSLLWKIGLAFFIISCTLEIWYHNSFFRGQLTIPHATIVTTFTVLVADNSRILLYDVEGKVTPGLKKLFPQTMILKDKAQFFETLTTNTKTFTLLFTDEWTEMRVYNNHHSLKKNYTSRRLIEKISQIQLRLFQVEKQPFWFRRTAKKLRNLQPDEIYFPTAVYTWTFVQSKVEFNRNI
ncbi:hypothetical protein PRIPAC_91349 [Pristionchus pacificus]|uniref:Uncharacterized protein n=1 Tax=Pristionchus pacificus TaxID=54126 RepID=A0A2A6B6J3_PRIPA|nr:hypothetical protein PRIPAC_91349 [Pristionchus pacificus]|eukprot:PDM61496.1 hypothetical protein PRIPAC_50938 [Pristionchus pacificus]